MLVSRLTMYSDFNYSQWNIERPLFMNTTTVVASHILSRTQNKSCGGQVARLLNRWQINKVGPTNWLINVTI